MSFQGLEDPLDSLEDPLDNPDDPLDNQEDPLDYLYYLKIFFCSSIGTVVSCIHICICNMNDSGVNNLIIVMVSPWSRIRLGSYGAYVAAENNTSGDIARPDGCGLQW